MTGRLVCRMSLTRFFRIALTFYRYGLDEFFAAVPRLRLLHSLCRLLPLPRDLSLPLPVRARLALESLGPVFVKFGQLLSTRRDLLPPDYADEFARLQDRVPPFDGALAQREVE